MREALTSPTLPKPRFRYSHCVRIGNTYQVSGMTCGHCVNSVQAEVGQVPGVTDVQVDLAAGTVTVTSDQPVDDGAIRAAVDEAGYELVG